MIAGVVAVVAVLVVTLVINPFGGGSNTAGGGSNNIQTGDSGSDGAGSQDNDQPNVNTTPKINYTTATYGQNLANVQGNCTLYRHVANEKDYQCFGLAGNYSVMATNEYKPAESEKYFCKPTVYGCKLYMKVQAQTF